jgi:hypothetical protein
MAWYARNPPPRPDWDVCWDFAKWGRRGEDSGAAAGTTFKGGRGAGRGKGGKGGGKWGQAQQAMTPQWWGMQPSISMWPPPLWQPPMGQPFGMKGMAAPKKGDPMGFGEAPLPSSLEKRLQQEAKPVMPPPPDKEFEGSLKSLSDRHGYGFIVCEEVHRIYGRDVYLPKELVPDTVKVLDRIRFHLTLSAKGYPQAVNIVVAPKV